MSQSKIHSHYEIITNQIAGIMIGFVLVYFVFPFIGVETTATQASLSSMMFFIASYSRAYAIRRIFNNKGLSMRTEDQEFEELEKKIGAETVDCSVLTRWNERYQK